MKKLTKILVVVLSLVLALGCFAIFAGCNNDKSNSGDYGAGEMNAWGDAFRLIGKMNEKGWFGSNWAGMDHNAAKTAFQEGNALFMIEGSWSRGMAKMNAAEEDRSSERILMQMPTVAKDWIYPGSPAGKNDAVVGGVTAGWMISRNAWNDESKRDALVAFVTTMTSKGLLDGAWAGTESFNPAGSISDEQWADSSLAVYSMMKMATKADTITAMDARLSPNAMTSLRAAAVNVDSADKDNQVKGILSTITNTNNLYYTPYLTYTAPASKGSKKVADIASTTTATLNVTTQFHAEDWQAGCYAAALNNNDGAGIWGYDNSADCLATKFPNITVKRDDRKVDNATKDAVNIAWANPAAMPDVLGWFSDAQAAVIRDDEHLVPVAEIQEIYGDYGSHLNAQFYDKYALPIVGTYEALYVNVKMLAGLEGFDTVKTAYDAYQADLTNNDKKVALYDEVIKVLGDWDNFAKACDAAKAAGKTAISQDKTNENNYLVDQAIMNMGGKDSFAFVPGAPEVK